MPDDALGLVGQVVDQLRFDELVDEGGFGYVYRGVHLGMDEPVAIKCLKVRSQDPRTAENFVKRFRDETKIAYRLSQGNLDIVRSISSGTLTSRTGALVPYMVLEWLEGQPLSAELGQRRDRGGVGMSLREMMELLESAAHALAFAHSQGVVHRDLKPGNLFLVTKRGRTRLKVLDFGLAKIVDPDAFQAPSGAETGSQMFIASPSYGAPEQFSNKLGPVGPWSDVYSLALVALEMLAARKVRHADSIVDGMMKALDPRHAEITPSKVGVRVSPAVEAVFAKATRLRSAERFRDAAELWAALSAAAEEQPDGPVTARHEPPISATMVLAKPAAHAGLERTVAMSGAPITLPPTPAPAPALNRTVGLAPGQGAPITGRPPPITGRPPPVGGGAFRPPAHSAHGGPSSQGAAASLAAPSSFGAASSQLAPRTVPPSSRGGGGGVPMWAAVLVALFLGAVGVAALAYAVRTSRR